MKNRKWLFWIMAAFATFIFGVVASNAGAFIYEKIRKSMSVVAFDTKIESIETDFSTQIATVKDGEPTFTETVENEFEPSGEYYIVDDLPSGFEDFEYLSLSLLNYDNASEANDFNGVSIPPEGFIFTKKKFRFERVAVSPTEFTFETVAVGGVKYKFAGRFVNEIKQGIDFDDRIFIKGILTKLKNGKQTAKANFSFTIMDGC